MDREGDLWVGTDNHGLNRVKPQRFQVLEGTKPATVQSVCEDAQGGLWIGYFGDRIDHWHDGVLAQVIKPEANQFAIKSVFVDRDQTVWAGTYRAGLRQLINGHFQTAPSSQALRREQEISALFQDHKGTLWAGTQAGLARWDGQSWSLLTNGLPASAVRAIAEDHAGNLWVGTEGCGLCRMRDGRFAFFNKTNGLPSDNVLSLYVDAADVLWAGTAGGLARFQGGNWTSFAGRPELAGGGIGYLLDDGLGYLWLGCNAGLMRVRKQDLNNLAAGQTNSLTVRSYGKADGLPTRECTQGSQPAACRGRDGTLWFPTTEGLVSLNPALLTRNTNPPPVLIDSVSVLLDGRLQGTNFLRSPRLETVTVPAGIESVEIHYTSLSLSVPDKGLFKYRLENYETTWTTRPGNVRSARYSKLPPGKYRFHVMACNEDGFWNEQGSSMVITVLPPFWQQWWFVTGVTLVLLGMIVGSVHYVSTQKLQRQLAVLRQQEMLEKERARIARDLHDQLGANLTQVALLGEMAETDKELPQEVEAHARQISQTARDTTRALDEIVWTVNPSNDTLDGLINYICKYAQEYLAMADLRYRLEVPSELPALPISPELRHNVFLAAKEAVNNVVKHAKADSAWVRLHLEPDRFVLEVEDNGRGVASGDAKKGRNGLRNMRKRMEDVGGQFEMSPRAEGGTQVRLTAPLHRPENGGC
jgi:signal transduction histidine kinase